MYACRILIYRWEISDWTGLAAIRWEASYVERESNSNGDFCNVGFSTTILTETNVVLLVTGVSPIQTYVSSCSTLSPNFVVFAVVIVFVIFVVFVVFVIPIVFVVFVVFFGGTGCQSKYFRPDSRSFQIFIPNNNYVPPGYNRYLFLMRHCFWRLVGTEFLRGIK